MKLLLFALLSIGTFQVQASSLAINGPLDETFFEAEVTQDKTYFETLGDLYRKGILPNLAKISNVALAGRCFEVTEPNNPVNAGYVLQKTFVGPLENVQTYRAASYSVSNISPDFFDDKSLAQILGSTLWASLKCDRPEFEKVIITSDTIVMSFDSQRTSNLRSSGKYMIEEIYQMENDAGPIGRTQTLIRCYYFIPNLNK